MAEDLSTEVCVIGAGISGLVTAKCMRDAGFEVLVLERTDDVGGLWVFRERGYGVMRFTHINVSKQNYCFSDFPFPEHVPDYPHNEDMAEYIRSYTSHFNLYDAIRFHTEVVSLERKGDGWQVTTSKVAEDENGNIKRVGEQSIIQCKYVAIASGHHAKPRWPNFDGQDNFKGEIIHSVDFKDAITNKFSDKRVLIVGIGNSGVDAAVNCVTEGRCKEVHLSTRSGAWVLSNYLFGCPTDHYGCRLVLWLPWKLTNYIMETVITVIQGHPDKWGLNPKMRALQTQPTVCPNLVFHIQRGQLKMHPNITRMEDKKVFFTDGSHVEVDSIVFCTGYSIDIPYLHKDIQTQCLKEGNQLEQLFKNVFSPTIGSSLAFIGFVQPASGGILSMSETQARWWAELCRGKIRLPEKDVMNNVINKEIEECSKRYYKSARHTIQKDPVLYNDDVSSMFGAKPQFWRHPRLAWRLLIGTCGAAQYRLQGPGKWSKAFDTVKSVPTTPFIEYGVAVVIVVLLAIILRLAFLIF
ncbi:Dimethylaniline monooxygenase [N-oxide-forming] 5 [Holothuria leucospilota]|uniref:Flavin-containing monooxygenase n=1 Tax=Holothuria leucospilota TaxID=206669 RepID=A0A9Q1BEA8_HOLLE|nr:Dimethylaniline monooxygenase [N-oxide-forming] 5 [Holothuria leucospilota]